MSNHPTIAALKAALESEREVEASKHRAHLKEVGIVTESGMASWAKCANAYNAGHEAATERLMGLIEKAVEMAEFYESGFEKKLTSSMMGHFTPALVDRGAKAREFLTTLADASGDINEENK